MTEKADILNNQAIQFSSDGDYEEAIACFKRAITLDKTNYLIWYNLGVTYRDAGMLEDAKFALKTAYGLAPDNEDVIETYATICLMLKEYSEVVEICQEGLDLNPLFYHLWNLLGVVEFQNEEYGEAAEYFEQAVSIYPYYLDALYNLKDTYSELNNKKGEHECQLKINELEK